MNNDTLYIETLQAPVFNVGGALVQFLASEVPFQEKSLDTLIGVLPPGIFVPLHSHTGPECFFLLEGEMEAYIGDESGGDWKTVRTGELVVIPPGVRHAWKNRSNAPVRVISFAGTNVFAIMRKVAIPAGQTQATAPPTIEFLQELQEAAARSGNWLATPEENAAIGLRL